MGKERLKIGHVFNTMKEYGYPMWRIIFKRSTTNFFVDMLYNITPRFYSIDEMPTLHATRNVDGIAAVAMMVLTLLLLLLLLLLLWWYHATVVVTVVLLRLLLLYYSY